MENEEKDKKTIFGKVANYKELHVYQKAEVLDKQSDGSEPCQRGQGQFS